MSVLAHQRAAHYLITSRFTPETMLQSETHRKAFAWYLRIDLAATMMSGGGTIIDRKWVHRYEEFHSKQVQNKPDDLSLISEALTVSLSLIAVDITLLLAIKDTEERTNEEVQKMIEKISVATDAFDRRMSAILSGTISSLDSASSVSCLDLSNPVHGGDTKLYLTIDESLKHVLIDFSLLRLVFLLFFAKPPLRRAEIEQMALNTHRMMRDIEENENTAYCTLLGLQTSLVITCLSLPKEEVYMNWGRRRFHLLQEHG